MAVYMVTQGCTLCGMCVYECPHGAITLTANGAWIDPKKCVGCGRCAENCASEAITKMEEQNDYKKEDEIG